jgi:hypothetical protein
MLIIDCGVLFPDDHHPGIDLILPDFAPTSTGGWTTCRRSCSPTVTRTTSGPSRSCWLASRTSRSSARNSPWPRRGQAQGAPDHALHADGERGPARALGVFDSSSSPSTTPSPMRWPWHGPHPGRTLLHTGDFKMDQLPLDGRLTDLRAFARLGEEGVDLFLTDSTNADVPGFTAPEREISSAVDKVFRHAQRRIIVACFSSHVHRVQQVLDAAQKAGRKVAMVGRSMVRNMGIAADLGYLHVPDGGPRRLQEARRPARRPGRLDLHRQPGRADGGVVADGQPRAPHRRRPRGHRPPRLVPHPRQRERRLSRHQRAHAARRPRRAQGQRQGPRLRSRRGRRVHSTATTSFGRAMSFPCTASGGTCSPTPSWRFRPA